MINKWLDFEFSSFKKFSTIGFEFKLFMLKNWLESLGIYYYDDYYYDFYSLKNYWVTVNIRWKKKLNC